MDTNEGGIPGPDDAAFNDAAANDTAVNDTAVNDAAVNDAATNDAAINDTGAGDNGLNDKALSRGGIVGARGTAEGLVMRMDGRVDSENLKKAVEDFVGSRERFLSGNDVTLEWVGEKPGDDVEGEIRELLKGTFNITVKASSLKRPMTVRRQSVDAEKKGGRLPFEDESTAHIDYGMQYSTGAPATGGFGKPDEAKGLFGGIEGLSDVSRHAQKQGAVDGNLWDDPNARIISSMLRSGQRIETEHSLVVFGDVNSGAELVAGGDIVVLGTLRGVAHAGAYDETGGGRTIFALNLQPTQLRIGSIISRGSGDTREKGPEIARVDKDIIIVEPYSAKAFLGRRRD